MHCDKLIYMQIRTYRYRYRYRYLKSRPSSRSSIPREVCRVLDVCTLLQETGMAPRKMHIVYFLLFFFLNTYIRVSYMRVVTNTEAYFQSLSYILQGTRKKERKKEGRRGCQSTQSAGSGKTGASVWAFEFTGNGQLGEVIILHAGPPQSLSCKTHQNR